MSPPRLKRSTAGWYKRGCTLHTEFKGPLAASRILNKGELSGKLCKNNQKEGNYGKMITSEQLFPGCNVDLNINLISFS